MVKRLLQIALLTGAAHIFTIITLKLLSKHMGVSKISSIGEIDSLFQLIINIVSFGLQLSAVRDIASSANWKEVYEQTQKARSTLGFLLMIAASLYFVKAPYQYFLWAPVFALSGDYALYGKGKPVLASLLAFCRVFIPSLVLIVFSIWQQVYIIPAYVISTVLVYWLTSLMIARWLHTSYWYKLSFKSLLLYVKSLSLGIVTLSYYFIGLGLLVVATNFYKDSVIAVAYLGLKLYMVFKGVLRIINQAFVKEMLDEEVGLKVDQMAGFVGMSFTALLLFFPQSFISLFFNEQYRQNQYFLLLTSLAGFIAAIFTSLTTRSMLQHKDKAYAQYSSVAAIISMALVIILSFFSQSPVNIGIALLAGEVVTAGGLLYLNKDIDIANRLLFLLQSAALLLAPVIIRLWMGDTYYAMLTGMLLFVLSGALLFYKKFTAIQTDKTTLA